MPGTSEGNSQNQNIDDRTRLKAIIETAIDGIITIDSRGTIESVNPAAARIFGFLPQEIIGQNIMVLMPEPDRSTHDQYIDNYHRTGVGQIIGKGREVLGRRKDGTVFPFLLSISEVKLHDKQIFTGIIHDITDQKKAEAALRESENKITSIIQAAVDGIITIDTRGIMEMVNPSAGRLFGYNPDELLGKSINMLMKEPDRSQHDGYIHNYETTGKRKIIGIGREVNGLRKDGSVFPFYLSISEVKLADRKVFTGFIHDITEQKLSEEKLRRYAAEIQTLNSELEQRVEARTHELAEAIDKLEASNKSLFEAQQEIKKALQKEKDLNELKSRFITIASHEFRTPLSTVLSSASLIGKYIQTEDDEKRQKHVNRIKSAVSNLTAILNDFLSLSRIEEGKVYNVPTTFELEPFAADIIDEMQGYIKVGQQLHYSHSGHPDSVTLDKQLLKNILINLLSNASKYSAEGKNIYLSTEISRDQVLIKVQDEGIGIPEADQAHLFSPFFRAQNAANYEGTGLGLNIVKRYIDIMNGSLTYQSKLNTGTTFTVQLPINSTL